MQGGRVGIGSTRRNDKEGDALRRQAIADYIGGDRDVRESKNGVRVGRSHLPYLGGGFAVKIGERNACRGVVSQVLVDNDDRQGSVTAANGGESR